MRRPFIEAGPLIAAAGIALLPLSKPHTGRLIMVPTDARFVFLPALDPATKPKLWSGLRPLAAYIESLRAEEAADADLKLDPVDDLRFIGRDGLFKGVQVWLLDCNGDAVRSLGWAYLDGRGSDFLEPRLREARLIEDRRAAA